MCCRTPLRGRNQGAALVPCQTLLQLQARSLRRSRARGRNRLRRVRSSNR